MTTYTPLARCLAFVLSLAILHPRGLLAQVNVSTQGGGGSFSGGALTSPTTVLDGSNFSVLNTADPTKQLRFDVSGVTTGTARTLTVPNVSSTIAVLGLAQTFTAVQTMPNGTAALPGLAFAQGTGYGVYAGGSILGVSAAGTALMRWASNRAQIGPGQLLCWTSSGDADSGSCDTGFLRAAAGVIRVSDSSGTAVRGLMGGGTAVASADPLPVPTGNVFHVTGTTNFTNLTTTNLATGLCFTMIFDGILTITDGGNLKLSANYTTSADDTLNLCFDGTNFIETGRSVN